MNKNKLTFPPARKVRVNYPHTFAQEIMTGRICSSKNSFLNCSLAPSFDTSCSKSPGRNGKSQDHLWKYQWRFAHGGWKRNSVNSLLLLQNILLIGSNWPLLWPIRGGFRRCSMGRSPLVKITVHFGGLSPLKILALALLFKVYWLCF